ncbi:MAG: hypothetical protein QOF29_832 [bacterium]
MPVQCCAGSLRRGTPRSHPCIDVERGIACNAARSAGRAGAASMAGARASGTELDPSSAAARLLLVHCDSRRGCRRYRSWVLASACPIHAWTWTMLARLIARWGAGRGRAGAGVPPRRVRRRTGGAEPTHRGGRHRRRGRRRRRVRSNSRAGRAARRPVPRRPPGARPARGRPSSSSVRRVNTRLLRGSSASRSRRRASAARRVRRDAARRRGGEEQRGVLFPGRASSRPAAPGRGESLPCRRARSRVPSAA